MEWHRHVCKVARAHSSVPQDTAVMNVPCVSAQTWQGGHFLIILFHMLAGDRESIRGARCLLPVSYAGQLQYECLVLPSDSNGNSRGGSSRGRRGSSSTTAAYGGPACPTGPRGDWEPCKTADSSTIPYNILTSGTGSPDSLIPAAVDIDGSADESRVGDTGSDESSAASAGAMEPNVSVAAQARLAAAVGSTVYTFSPTLPRFTLSGQACLGQPYWFVGKLVQAGQCTSIRGREVCPVLKPLSSADYSTAESESVTDSYDMLQCDPLVSVPAFSTFCWIAAMPNMPDNLPPLERSSSRGSQSISNFEEDYRGTQSSMANSAVEKAAMLFEGCVVQGALEFCKVRGQGGPWVLCPAGELLTKRNHILGFKASSTSASTIRSGLQQWQCSMLHRLGQTHAHLILICWWIAFADGRKLFASHLHLKVASLRQTTLPAISACVVRIVHKEHHLLHFMAKVLSFGARLANS